MNETSSKRIAFLIADMQAGGAQRVAAMLCNEWGAKGKEISILTYEQPGSTPFYELSSAIAYKPLELQEESAGIVQGALSNIKRVLKIRAALKTEKPDVVLGFGAEAAAMAIFATKGLSVPVIACERSDPHIYPQGIWKKLRDMSYVDAHRIVCQTDHAAEYFKHLKNVTVIPNPVTRPDTSGKADIARPEKRFIVSLGRLSREKGQDLLIEAFAKIAEQHVDVDLLLIGDGPDRDRLRDVAFNFGVESRVHMPGAAKNPFPILTQADVFVLPSRFEGFPNALCEAMALGLPCIATDATGARALIKNDENGIIIPHEDTVAMAGAIEHLLMNPHKAGILGEKAKEITQTLSMPNVMIQWDKIL